MVVAILICLIFLSSSNSSWLKVEIEDDISEHWTGCILRKTLIAANPKDPCYHCTVNPKIGVPLEIVGWNQRYINCSDFCDHITICTETKYFTVVETNSDPVLAPVCYQCDNTKDEHIYYQLIRHDELCKAECIQCAFQHDILTATECAKICLGRPTFCYPIQFQFTYRKCYQATHWFGCVYKPVVNEIALSSSCRDCSKQAKTVEEAQDCAVECNGLPSYHEQDANNTIVQCVDRPPSITSDFFYYEIPPNIIKYMHVSNPGNIYPASALSSYAFSSFVGKIIFRKFNMSLMTWPRPLGYEHIKL